ncbi:hypothetical protein ASPZODRAFT_96755 [Penicilliopsis zonata CBS 506.65]|uniref:Uncharacterized protein n=1 Tax=Penicilliopsis zonata CBS 506.65 TaxID=1073090 RepID=A0A1L9SH65_9EURO|nr:hypothetical protein ASPZODRAFT_96755 [Penicilliopsis zonata CBS 506.65]OJJ46491.1 hypothetical protein ASPZODRAFT_96755 [Penicilliopsis zonata CBS 506.65]
MMKPPPHCRDDFEIAIICALQTESDAVEAVLEERWEYTLGKAQADPNSYITGRICRHNVVLVSLPGMGKARAASATASLLSSFPAVKLGLVVGVCGGVPTDPTDTTREVLLGDAIISTGIVQYDFGRRLPNKMVRKTDGPGGHLSRPSKEIQSFLRQVSGLGGRRRLEDHTLRYLTEISTVRYPGQSEDRLYHPTYRHRHYTGEVCTRCAADDGETCERVHEISCDESGCGDVNLVSRRRRLTQGTPQIHFGLVASGDLVMKSGGHRDEIAKTERAIAFEMEGAGVCDNVPTVIIKGVCDYADSHKNKKWQAYAAAVGAACMKAFLRQWIVADQASQIEEITRTSGSSSRRADDPWLYKTSLFLDPRSEEASLVESYDYVYFVMVVVIWNLQQRLKTRRFVASLLLALHHLCLSPLSPLSWRCVRFEDALGRRQLLPFELCRNLEAFDKFLIDNFQAQPGWHRVRQGEYLMVSGRFGGAVITPQQWLYTIQPGGLLTMVIQVDSKRNGCPRCGQKVLQAGIPCGACLLHILNPDTALAARPVGPRTVETTAIAQESEVNALQFKYTYSIKPARPIVSTSRLITDGLWPPIKRYWMCCSCRGVNITSLSPFRCQECTHDRCVVCTT